MIALRRLCFAFSLRTLFVAMAVAALFMGWFATEAKLVRDRKAFLSRMRHTDGKNYLPLIMPNIWLSIDDAYPKVPFWRRWLGDDAKLDVLLPVGTTEADLQIAKQLFPEALAIEIAQPGSEINWKDWEAKAIARRQLKQRLSNQNASAAMEPDIPSVSD